MKNKWTLQKNHLMGGTIALGIDHSSKYLLVISHSGRGLIDLVSGQILYRDEESLGDWYRNDECDGIGVTEGEAIKICGLDSKPTDEVKVELKAFNVFNQLTEFKGAIVSPDCVFFAIGYSDVIEVYKSET